MKRKDIKIKLVLTVLMLLTMTQGAWALSTDTDGYYLIGSAQDLKDFAALVNSGNTTANGKLIAPIDLQGSESNQWTPIGTGTWYNGTFDGQGFTISNLYYHQTEASPGLFGHAGGSAHIKNVRVIVDIDNTGHGATTFGGATEAGGILGTGKDGAVIINCSVAGSVISYSNVGGIVGSGTVTIVNSYNEATVKFFSNTGQVGCGIHGFGGAPTLINCYNVGKIINNGGATSHMGNISVNGTATNCYSLENCCQNGAGAEWSNRAGTGITGATMTLSEMQAASFTNTLYSNAYSLRATYPDFDRWMQAPTTGLPILQNTYKPTEGPWTRQGVISGWTGIEGSSTTASWNGLNDSQWDGLILPYSDDTNGLGTQMAGTSRYYSKQAIYSLYSTTQTVPSYSVMAWKWDFRMNNQFNLFAQQTALYTHTNLNTLKNAALNFDVYSNTETSDAHRVGNINAGSTTLTTEHYFWFDNRYGSSDQSRPVYMIQTHIMWAAQSSTAFGTQRVSFKDLGSSYTYYYYKHVTFDANGGTGSMGQLQIENSGTLTANAFTRSGYTFAGWNTQADGKGTSYADQATLTATSSDKGPITLYAQWDFEGTGTEGTPYLISSVDHWNLLADNVNAGNTYSGKYFRLTDNISVTTMVGNSESHSFRGTFDGDGHTLNITYSNNSDYTAPFRYIQGATFKNLKVTGTITTSMNFAAGIAGLNTNAAATFDQCVTDVAINSSSTTVAGWSNYDYHGGLLARTNSANVTITDCACGGSVDGSSSTQSFCAGLVGVAVSCTVSATRCLSTTSYTNVRIWNTLCHADNVTRSASVFYFVNGNDISVGERVTTLQLADATYATALQAGRAAKVWVQDGQTNQPMLLLFAKIAATLIDGEGITALNTYGGLQCDVNYTREFTEGKASTVCLPFAYTKKEGDGSFYAFKGITKDDSGNYVATMTESNVSTLTANKPYLYMPSATGSVNFSGTYTIPDDLTAGSTTSGDWTFLGTYTTESWTTAPTGIYGFSAQDVSEQGISQGQFVKVGAYVRVKPMRCYLKYKNGGENYTGARGMNHAAADEELPETISVRLVSVNGDVEAIGTLHTEMGEVTLDGWYTLDGTRLSGQPTRKGIYIQNGKKIVIK